MQRFGTIFSTISSRLNAWLAGIELGAGSRFHGMATFRCSPNASVRFGQFCVFRSGATSNLIGINRPCIVSVQSGAALSVGSRCGFSGTVIGCFKEIKLGERVRCGANTIITDGDWHQDDPRSGPPRSVVIEDDVWLGTGVIVLKGVTIGRNSVIGAGSVVTRDIPADVVAAGNPCRVLKALK